jgi:DUF1009 family protein
MAAMAQGDDATLRVVIELFEEFGFTVVGVNQVAPALLPGAGVLAGSVAPRTRRMRPARRPSSRRLARWMWGRARWWRRACALGSRRCRGPMRCLRRLPGSKPGLRPDPARGRGVFYKAAKPGQDRRIDLPTIGPETLRGVAAAGLAGWRSRRGR